MSSDWWARKLSNAPQPPQRTLQPVQAPIRFPTVTQPQRTQEVLDPNHSPNTEIHMGDAIRMWKGGEAARREGDMACPSCGSHLVFSRSKGGGVAGKAPAPRCFSCGYNGLYDQGDQTNWAV